MIKCNNCGNEIKKEYKFCPFCGLRLSLKIKCSYCNSENDRGAKYCHECGNELPHTKPPPKTESKAGNVNINIDIPIPDKGITIEFNRSSSATFEFAVNAARKFESYTEIGEGKKAKYRVTVNEDELEDLDELLESLKGWRNRHVYLNGEKVPWDSILQHTWCYARRKASYKPELFCFGYEQEYSFNLWGCMHTSLSFNEHSKLFQCGKWLNSKGDWEFDKNRIKFELNKELHQYRFCPAINFPLIIEILDVFPKKVNPKKDDNWKFVESYSAVDGLKIVTNNK
jgi:hypothetical protein